jgi:DNA-binding HxlR family transcriptional regulator
VLHLAAHPGCSNREIANAIGMAYQSQASRLLTRLTDEGMLVKHSNGVGKRYEWRLTQLGEEAARVLMHS